jgi:predicted nucleotidyltransferase
MPAIKLATPLHPATVQILKAITRVAAAANCPCLLIGATARDILLHHRYNFPIKRATKDVDIAFAVESWDEFDKLKSRLIEEADAIPTAQPHRLTFELPGTREPYPVDLIPFGAIASENHALCWPPDMAHVMNMIGYREAMETSEYLEIDVGFEIRIASLAGLAVLKLFAWQDRGDKNRKDAQDLYLIMTNYAEAGNTERLFDTANALMERYEFDMDYAGVHLLGWDIAEAVCSETRTKMCVILETPASFDQLTRHMLGNQHYEGSSFSRAQALLTCLRSGITERQ